MTKMVVVVVDVEVVAVICQKNNKKLKIKIRKQTYVGSISSTRTIKSGPGKTRDLPAKLGPSNTNN